MSAAPASPALFDRLILSALPFVPTPLMRRFSARYIAGEELSEALDKLAALASGGYPGIVDILGENVTAEPEARSVLADYKSAADGVKARGLDAHISVKPTHFGLAVSEELAFELYDDLARHCAGLGLMLRVEMEDHPTTDATLRIFEGLRATHDNVGIVLHATEATPCSARSALRSALPPRWRGARDGWRSTCSFSSSRHPSDGSASYARRSRVPAERRTSQ